MSDITHIERVQYLTEDQVREEIIACYGWCDISDAAAASIASWWQGPVGHGLVFQQMASGMPFSVLDLLDAIAHDRRFATSGFDTRCFDLLAAWARQRSV